MTKTKSFTISKELVREAYLLVKANKGSAGVDEKSLADFEKDLSANLYKLWNRLSSGTYFPSPVKGVAIPKKQGGERILGIPTVTDRIAQAVVKMALEPNVEPFFKNDSYGYRPHKSALDAVEITRQRCWRYDWVLEFDIRGLFDNIDHELLMKAVRKHTNTKWIILYIERWLKASMRMQDGTIKDRTCGTPQGGVISPLLSNLFLHYVFDEWMTKYHNNIPWCRYADDGLVHCKSEAEAQAILNELRQRFAECKLELHPDKTKIVYCKDGKRTNNYINTKFKFLGFEFRRRLAKGTRQEMFLGFNPAICKEAKKAITKTIRRTGIRERSDLSIEQVAEILNPMLNGWINYYGRFNISAMKPIMRQLNITLVKWCKHKYKRFRKSTAKAMCFMIELFKNRPLLFAHWKRRIDGSFV